MPIVLNRIWIFIFSGECTQSRGILHIRHSYAGLTLRIGSYSRASLPSLLDIRFDVTTLLAFMVEYMVLLTSDVLNFCVCIFFENCPIFFRSIVSHSACRH